MRNQLKSIIQIILLILLILIFSVNIISVKDGLLVYLILSIVILGSVCILKKRNLIKPKYLYILAILLLLAGTVVRVYSFYKLNFNLNSDFELYYNSSISILNKKPFIDPEYLSYNGYVVIFSTVLAIFFRIFGVSITNALWFNFLCQIGTMLILYKILRLFSSKEDSIFFISIWYVLPTVIGANLLISTETLFILVFLMTLYFYLKIKDRENTDFKSILYFIILGLLISFANVIRPVMIVFIIALIIVFILSFKRLREFILLTLTICSFLVSNLCFNAYIEKTLNMPLKSGALEWSLYFGSNYDSRGYWNLEDSIKVFDILNQDDGSKILIDETINRYKDLGVIKTLKLYGYKYYHLWSDINGNFIFVDSITSGTISKYEDILKIISYIIVLNLIYFTILELFREIKNKNFKIIFFELFIVGYILSNLLIVVNGRYNYPIYIFLVMMSAAFFSNKKEQKI